ncbi:MAG: DnaJ domain-containing protein [Myxococcales bacterium]|nr:DnaJ domain-containing protein [Myxococcales bacterium]
MERRIPSPVAGIDILALPLSTLEGFVLSRADGSSSVEDIAMMVGVELDKLILILERLADLGAVQLPWLDAQRKQRQAEQAAKEQQERDEEASRGCIYDNPSVPPSFDSKELDGASDIDRKTRRRILNAYYSLSGRNFYQAIGVSEMADKAEIRSAYFALSKQFHPDAFFGKDLGHFKSKMEAVFKRLTEAYEVLGRKARRSEYDEYLRATNQAYTTQTKIEQVQARAQALRQPKSAPAPKSNAPRADASNTSLRAPRVPREAKPVTSDPPTHTQRRVPSTEDKRRERAAGRLKRQLDSVVPPERGRVQAAVKRPSEPRDGTSARERRDSAIRGLARSLSDSAQLTGGPDRVSEYVTMARQAEAAGDMLSAVNALQLALALDAEDEELREYYGRLSKVVAEDLARNYEKQARYEEKVGKWSAAARSWRRVVEGRPEDAEAARHTAEALMRSGGDLHEAQRYAQSAADLQPDSVVSLVVLARVMLAAGLKLSARRELEKAVKLDPTDDMVKNLLKETR